jgi:peptidoglycan/LPS O-acetylase OafA/YrhL
VGRISYSVYLLHGTGYLILRGGFDRLGLGPDGRAALMVALGIPAILAACAAFHHLVERPFMSRKAG